MKNLREILKEAENNRVAVGHFNVSDLVALKAVFGAALEISSAGGGSSFGGKFPVIIGVSEGEREFIGVRQIAALVESLREEFNYPIYLNADHTHSLEKAEEAARAGFDEILFDGSKLDFEENIKQTKKAVQVIKSINKNILVEGEIGFIGSSSEIIKERPEAVLTMPEEAKRFVKETGVDVLAPAVGNMHGLLARTDADGTRTYAEKRLDIERIKTIKKATGKFLTLHGGSGTADEDFVAAIKAGINIIHINTELRIAWRKGVEEGLAKSPDEIAPYKILPPAVEEIKKVVGDRLRLFNKL
jgi:fructose-bisphosphate aldolase class II